MPSRVPDRSSSVGRCTSGDDDPGGLAFAVATGKMERVYREPHDVPDTTALICAMLGWLGRCCVRVEVGMGGEFAFVLLVKPGVELFVDDAGRWMLRLADGRVYAAEDRYLWLLPLLEKPHGEVEAAVTGSRAVRPFPLTGLVRFALNEQSQYWIGLALAWLEAGFPTSVVVDVLQAMKDDLTLPQPLRHRALRLWLTHRRRGSRGSDR